MKQVYLKCLFLGILTLFSTKASAYDCEVDGIYYNSDKPAKKIFLNKIKYPLSNTNQIIVPGTDCTNILTNPAFGSGTGSYSTTGWTGSAALGGLSDYMCAESYETTVDFYQTVKDAPAGIYKIETHAFVRPTYNGGYDGTENINCWLYMNNLRLRIQNIMNDVIPQNQAVNLKNCYLDLTNEPYWPSDTWTTGYDYLATGYNAAGKVVEGFVPNCMIGAAYAFRAGRYAVSTYGLVGDGEDMKIGVTSDGQKVHWLLFSGFKLTYLGKDVDAINEILHTYVTELESYLNNNSSYMTQPAVNEATKVLNTAKSLIGSTDSDALWNVVQSTYNALINAKANNAAYIAYKTAFDTLNEAANNPKVNFDAYEEFVEEKDAFNNFISLTTDELITLTKKAEKITDAMKKPSLIYAKVTAIDGTISWIEIKCIHTETGIEISDGSSSAAINHSTSGVLDINEIWSQSGGQGKHYQITSIGANAFIGCKGLTSIIIPNSVISIGKNAFYDCEHLSSLFVYSADPPKLASDGVTNIQGLIVYVPDFAINLYKEAEGWNFFEILSILDNSYNLTVSLPENTAASDYTQMWLELTNRQTGQRMHYVMTERTRYTFTNIPYYSSWDVVLRNERGDIFGQIDNVEVKDEDVSVSFTQLSKPQNLEISVLTPDGKDVTNQIQITWVDVDGNYLSQSSKLSGLPVGFTSSYRISLSQELAMLYDTPSVGTYTLKNGNNQVVCQLAKISNITLSGTVKDASTNMPLNGAIISASQTFGGKYSKTVNTTTASNGQYTLTLSNVPTTLAIAATDYVSQTLVCDSLMQGSTSINVPTISLKEISGAVLSIGLTYTTCLTGNDDEDNFQEWYSDYKNISYSIYNKTKKQNISQFNVQYPQIVLLETVDDGNVLELTATSRVSAFMPVISSTTVQNQRADIVFNIVELGKIQASFSKNSNASVVGSLYDVQGKLIKTFDYTNASLVIENLADGNYTLVTMGSSTLFNTIYDLAQLPQTGLSRGVDYVQNSVEVKSGNICSIDIAEVPTLNESKLYYTGNNTSFTVNKPSIVVGNYLTLTGHIDFKPAYATIVSNVQMVVDLPESCQFVENSVMVGNSTSSYTINGNRITIPLTQYTDRVRFCVIPTLGGDYAPSAFAQFDLNGKTVTQPIGSANYAAKDLSISVPSIVAKTSVPISGTAIGTSTIDIYDNDVLIGQTTSLANGTWATTCELKEPYNLSRHQIQAKVTTKVGLELQSETLDCTYDMNAIEAKTVTMSFYNGWLKKNIEVVFDLQNKTIDQSSYMFYTTTDITFVADLTNNDTTVVNSVTIRVYTDKNNWRNLEAHYDAKKDKWVAVSQFGSNELPVGIDVVIDAKSETIADRDKIDEDLSASNSLFAELEQNMDRVNHLLSFNQDEETSESFTVLQNYLESDNYDALEVNKWIQSVMYNQISGDVMTEEMADSLTILYQKELDDFTEKLKNSPDSSVFALLYLPTELDLLAPTSEDVSFEHKGYIYMQKKWTPVSVENLLNDGFLHYNLTDSTQVFFKYEDSGLIIIDTKKAVEFSMLPLDKANSRSNMPRRASNASGFALCVKDWNLLVTNILKYKDINTNLDLKNVLTIATQVRGTVQGIIDASSCFYRDYYITFKYNLDNSYKKFVKEIEDKIEARRNLIDKHWERIKVQNDMISQQEEMIRQYQKNIDELFAQAYNTSDPNVLDELEKQIKHNEDLIKASQEHIKLNKQIISDINTKDINQIEKQINRLSNEREAIEEGYKLAEKTVKKIPTLSKGKKAVSVWTKLGKLAGPLGILCDVADIFATGWEAYDEINEWIDLGEAMLRKLPCEGNPDEAELLCKDIVSNFIDVVAAYASILGTKAGATALNAVDVPVFTPHWWIASGLNIYAEWANLWASNKYITLRGDFWGRMYYLKCKKDDDKCPKCGKKPCTCDNKCPKCGENPCICKPPYPLTSPIHDPSGYVYEGVTSNRIEGVTSTAYYKEMVEDMYGDLHENIVKWDAAEYAQENPLFTDENGYYRWDVPQGLWQVKFEKEGYETTYSEWLPVPPPQLDINIAMKQNVQPNVKNARAYGDAVEVEFDKYMMPEYLTTDNIVVMCNNNAVEGTVVLLNEEVSYEGASETFASKVRFNAAEPFNAKEVTLIVNNRVRSYAGIRMQDNFSQTFDVELEAKEIVCDANTILTYGENGTLAVRVLPASAAAGKTLYVKTSSPMILGVDEESVTLDNQGQAIITITGNLPGTAALTFSLEGYDLSATTIVNIEQKSTMTVANPSSNIASGSIVERGTAIYLSCETEGATIYYTLDGSCPCDESSSRKIYDGTPIIINDNVNIKVWAIAPDMYESDVIILRYVVEGGNAIDDIALNGKINIYPLPVRDKLTISTEDNLIKQVTLNNVNGSTLIENHDMAKSISLDVSHLSTGIYIINIVIDDKLYSKKIIKTM